MTLSPEDQASLAEFSKKYPDAGVAVRNWLASATDDMRRLALSTMSWYDMADFANVRIK